MCENKNNVSLKQVCRNKIEQNNGANPGASATPVLKE